jgi:hypothetical protein
MKWRNFILLFWSSIMNVKLFSSLTAMAVVGALSINAFGVSLKKVRVKGQLLDMNCYSAHGLKGRAHGRTCGKNCLLSGAPAGILVHGHAWTLDANPRPLAPYVGMMIRVTGRENARDHVLLPMTIKVDVHGKWKTIKLIPLFKPVGKAS